MTKTNLAIALEEEKWLSALKDVQQISNQVLVATINYLKENEDIDFMELDKPININVVLSNDKDVQALNKEYRDKDKATNVLSFALIDSDDFEDNLELFEEIEMGDIIIALETMQREATEANISLQEHYCHLLAHGILHLFGFDHIEDDEAEYMESFEINILKNLDIKNPYA